MQTSDHIRSNEKLAGQKHASAASTWLKVLVAIALFTTLYIFFDRHINGEYIVLSYNIGD